MPKRDLPEVHLRCCYDLDLYTGQWRQLSSLPVKLSGASCAVYEKPDGKRELWLIGGAVVGPKLRPTDNLDAYIYSFCTDSWSVEPNILDDRCGRYYASMVIYGSLCCVFGGGSVDSRRLYGMPGRPADLPSPDVCFDLTSGQFVTLPERPLWKSLRKTKALLVGSCVVVMSFAVWCVNTSTIKYSLARPSMATSCCNGLHYLDLEVGSDRLMRSLLSRWKRVSCMQCLFMMREFPACMVE
jgi:hypothetical protein